MTSAVLIFDGDVGTDGPTYTPQVPGAAPTPPVTVSPTPTPSAPAPAAIIAAAPPPVPTPRRAPTALPVPVVAGTARFAANDYAGAARALLPRGRAWPAEPDSVQSLVLGAIGKTFERSDAVLSAVFAGSVPGSLTAMLPEWEATLGLPDPCAGDTPTIEQRLDQVRGRFVGAGGQSRNHFIDFAAALGFTIEIVNYAPFRAGLSTVGNPLAGDEWSFVWGIHVVATTGALPIDVLMCEFEAAKPAETTVILLS